MKTYTIIIIGSGFGGQCAAINLLRRGISDFLILERRDFAGGTWLQNDYPGAAVDVQSPLYSISYELYPWTQMFATQAELAQYTRHVLEKYGLLRKIELGANVVSVRWNEAVHRWHVQTAEKGEFCAQILINASGFLSTPVIPAFPGRETFRGHAFHTNHWDHRYDYTGKRVAIIGSGASAAQVIPAIAERVQQLHVFQRTPHWVLPRPDRRFSAFEQGLLRHRALHKALRLAIYWTLEWRMLGFKYSQRVLNFVAQRKALRLLERQVADPELRRQLTPDFAIGCKRIILSNTYYPALQRPNVRLHTQAQSVARINESGIVTKDGQQIDVDLIVWSTGYDATDGVISYPVVGRGGKTLSEFWQEYPRAYLGTTMPGFPNLFLVNGPNTAIGHTSAIFVIEAQMQYIMQSLESLRRRGSRSIEVKADAEARYTTTIHAEMQQTVWNTGGCQSWYQNKSGRVTALFPGFSFTYRLWTGAFKPQHHVYD